ncbi:hypothetical protein [Heyndrickxia oleronia]|nr:hypothetical protein [Heyndrickxia oleronia]
MSGRLFDPEEQGAATRQKRKAKVTGLLRQAEGKNPPFGVPN